MAQETLVERGDDFSMFEPSPAHAALRSDLQDLEAIAHPDCPQPIERLRLRLAEVSGHVLTHFRSEEDGGWFDHVRRDQPRLDRAVQELIDEHERLRDSLERLAERCRAATAIDAEIRETLRAFVGTMRQHESREDDLIQEAYNRDIGPAD